MTESQNIEYKKSWRDEYLKWICGFANAQGGSIYIGKDDDGNVVGIKNAKKLLEDIPNKVRDILGIIPDSQDKSSSESIQKSSLKSSLKIVLFMQEDKNITIPEIAKKIGITERGVKKQISKMKADGKIKRVGPDKGGYWEVLK